MEGLRFACQPGCTACCEQKGFVYLTEADLVRIAAYVGITVEEFERRYIYRTRNYRRLRKPPKSQCHFLDKAGCRIHAVKPTQCRIFPFWPHLVEDREAWCATAEHCPGIGKGPLIQIGTALEISREMREAYPAMYA